MPLASFPDLIRTLIGPDSPDILWWQMCVRAMIVLVFGLFFVRLAGKRTFGKLSAFDIVLAIIVGSNLSRTLTASAPFWETLLATAALGFVHWGLGRLSIHWHWLGALIKGSPRQIVRDGEVDRQAMTKGELSHGDLEEALRLHGLDRPDPVKAAYLERSGAISVVRKD